VVNVTREIGLIIVAKAFVVEVTAIAPKLVVAKLMDWVVFKKIFP